MKDVKKRLSSAKPGEFFPQNLTSDELKIVEEQIDVA